MKAPSVHFSLVGGLNGPKSSAIDAAAPGRGNEVSRVRFSHAVYGLARSSEREPFNPRMARSRAVSQAQMSCFSVDLPRPGARFMHRYCSSRSSRSSTTVSAAITCHGVAVRPM
jgi:hypothetical protein